MEVIILYLALLAGAFFLLVVRPQRKQLAARRALIASLEVGDDVVSAGGIYGTVVAIDDATVVLCVADGVNLTVAREAVSGRQPLDLTQDSADVAEPAPDESSTTDG
jgi:preprotein translocase subunit YajC